jgi:hypothetical protein
MRTSEDVLELGLYTSDCCNQELIFDTGDTFCRCPGCESLCRWELESRITPIDAIESTEEPQYSTACAAVA